MRKLAVTALLVLGMAAQGWATPITYSGSISNKVGDGTLVGTSLWNDDKTSTFADVALSWSVDNTTNAGFWTYIYTFTADDRSPSHEILELSANFTDGPDGNFKAGTTGSPALDSYSSADPSNPGMPALIYGAKWDSPSEGMTDTLTIVTDRAPMWGDFYAKTGKYVWHEEIQVWVPTTYKPNGAVKTPAHWETQTINHQEDVYAYSKMFGTDPSDIYAVGNGNNGGWVLVPDTKSDNNNGGGRTQEVPVPEPGTVVLLGSGLLGMALYGRRRLSR